MFCTYFLKLCLNSGGIMVNLKEKIHTDYFFSCMYECLKLKVTRVYKLFFWFCFNGMFFCSSLNFKTKIVGIYARLSYFRIRSNTDCDKTESGKYRYQYLVVYTVCTVDPLWICKFFRLTWFARFFVKPYSLVSSCR